MAYRYEVERRLELFPVTARMQTGGLQRLTVGGCDLENLAAEFGTPLYLYDQETLDQGVASYRRALRSAYPGSSSIVYAGKAFLCLAMAQWAEWRALWLDCTGLGELSIAGKAGVPRSRVVAHGVNKSEQDLSAALRLAGTIVVDNLAEVHRLAEIARRTQQPSPQVWLRIRPGVDVQTHAHTRTGHTQSKFGMDSAEVEVAARTCLEMRLPIAGLHFHVGSQLRDLNPIGKALDSVLELADWLESRLGWRPTVLSPGGGLGCAYHEDDPPWPSADELVNMIASRIVGASRERGLGLPRLCLEPGRSVVGRAGVALYRIGTVKRTAERRWLLLDGGLADNPRPALYGARYTALPVERLSRPAVGNAWLAGPYCESGDILAERLSMPDLEPGELVAVPVSGAYQLSMASNYNGARRPAVVWLHQGTARLIQRREEAADLVRRDESLR